MEHPGVKALLDRILKQNGGHVNTLTLSNNAPPIKLKPDINSQDGLEIVFDNPNQVKHLHIRPDESQGTSAFTNFKENLRARMKARRQEMRKEEEEDDKMDEEYHDEASSSEDVESDVEDGGNCKQNKVSLF